MVNSDFSIALHCMLLLALDSEKKWSSMEFADELSINPARIRKILGLLKTGNLVRSIEGNQGGFLIGGNPVEIRLDVIYEVTIQTCLKPKVHKCPIKCSISENIEGAVTDIFNKADVVLKKYLHGITLKEVLKEMQK